MRESNAEHQASVTVQPSPAEPVRGGPSHETVGGSSSLRHALLLRLRHDGPSSPEDLAAGLGVSRTGVLQQLHALETAGLVSRQAVRHGVFDERRRITRDRIRQRMADRLSPEARLVDRARELAVIQDEQGYLAEATIGADGVIRLVERNCAIHRVAADNGAACQAELDLFREILGPDVERETHIAAGDRCCTYRIGSASD